MPNFGTNRGSDLTDVSAVGGVAVTPDVAFAVGGVARQSKAIYVGAGGDVQVSMADGTTPIFPAVPAGFYLYVYANMVIAAGTTAAGMVAMW